MKRKAAYNSTYPKVAVQWLNQALCFNQSFCLVDSEVLRNRHLRVAAKRSTPLKITIENFENMGFWNALKNILTGKPKNITAFIHKFIRESNKSRVQLEIIRDNEILIQVDSLKFTPFWFNVFNVDRNEFENGFVIFFIIDLEEIETNTKYILYKKSELNLEELDEMHGDTPIRTFAKFIKETHDPVFLGEEIKKILDVIFVPSEPNPQAIFNLRYIEAE